MMSRSRIIEGTWNCTSCDQKDIPGREKVCPSCGNPREDEEAKFHFGDKSASGGSTKESVTDAEALELAAAGADWYCANCGTANRGDATACKSCGNSDPSGRLAKKPEKIQAPPPPPPPPKPAGKKTGCIAALIALLVLVCAGLCGWYFLATHEVPGRIESMAWERNIHLETFTQETRSGWRSELSTLPSIMPVNGHGERSGTDNLRGCRRQEKTPAHCEQKSRRVACGTEEKCSVKDLGNGFAEEKCEDITKYCDEPYEECYEAVFDDRCTYDTWEWRRQNTKSAKGADNRPQWPAAPPMGRLDRHVPEEKYTLQVSYDDGGEKATGETSLSSEAEFIQYAPGQTVSVSVNSLGVQGVAPLSPPPTPQ